MHQQAMLRIDAPAEAPPLRAAEFRELLARTADRNDLLPPAFFNYDTQGNSLSGAPDIRIIGGTRWVGIVSESGNEDMLDRAMGLATRASRQFWGKQGRVSLSHPEMSATPIDGVRTYYLRDMVIKRRSRIRQSTDTAELVHRIVLDGLDKAARRQGIDLPLDADIDLRLHDMRELGLPIKVSNRGMSGEYATLVQATCTMAVDLRGIWQVGALQARGYGRIVPCPEGGDLRRAIALRGGVIT